MLHLFDRDRLFRKFLTKYLLVLAVPIVLGAVLYSQAISTTKANIHERHMSVLQQARDTMDNQLRHVNDIIVQLDANPKVRKLLSEEKPVRGAMPVAIMESAEEIHSQVITSDFIVDFQVYFRKPEVLITTGSTYIRLPMYYSPLFFMYEDVPYSSWRTFLDGYHQREVYPATKAIFTGKSRDVVPYVQSIPLSISTRSYGAIVFFINEDKILNTFAGIDLGRDGFVAVTNAAGRVITASDGYSRSDSRLVGVDAKNGPPRSRESVLKATSGLNGWNYIAVTPPVALMSEVRFFRRMASLVIGLVLVIGALLALLFSYRNSVPIRNLLSLTRQYEPENPEQPQYPFRLLQNTISHLLTDNAAMNNSLLRQRQMLAKSLSYRLLRGEFSGTSELEPLLRHSGIEFSGSRYTVVVLDTDHFHDSAAAEAVQEIALESIRIVNRSSEGIRFISHQLDDGSIALLAACKAATLDMCRNQVDIELLKIEKELAARNGPAVTYAAGSFRENLIDVNRSFEEARQTLLYGSMHRQWSGHWFDEIEKTALTFYYPIHIEFRLANAIKAGDLHEVRNLLDQIESENFIVRELSPPMAKHLVSSLKHTMIKVIDDAHALSPPAATDFLEQVATVDAGSGMYESLISCKRLMAKLCDLMRSHLESHNKTLRDGIIATIEKCYSDPDLGLASLAGDFDMNQSYLSRFFKEQTGENLSAYIERLRLTRAETLLREGASVSTVYSGVGYRSASVFRRAFKRYFGVQAGSIKSSAAS